MTGGAGFIGSNLAHRLAAYEARVTVLDSLLPNYGGNLFNLEGVRERVWLTVTDLRDVNALAYLIGEQEIIFNLAGQVSHEDSMTDPMTDLDINCRSQAALLETCRHHNRSVRIVYASTRQVYGRPQYLPVDEEHPRSPVDVNGINKLSAEKYHLLYHHVHDMWTCALRLTNTFGPRQLIKHARQGFIAWFMHQGLVRGEIQLFGGGAQLRELTYVDDVVNAFLLAAMSDAACGQIFNLGGERRSLAELASCIQQLCPGTTVTKVPFPADRLRIDIGDYYANWDKVRTMLGWTPRVSVEVGLERSLAFFREHLGHYIT